MKIRFKILILTLLSCLLIYTVSPSGFLSNKAFANGEGSTIGGITVDGMKSDEIRTALQKGINSWQDQPVIVTGGGASVEIDTTIIQYDFDKTIQLYESKTKKPWYKFWEKDPIVHIPLVLKPSEEVKEIIATQPFWETDATYSNVMSAASNLQVHNIDAVVSSVVKIDNERIAVAIKEVPASITNIQQVVAALDGQIISAGEEFNFLTQVVSILKSSNKETLSFAASVLYESALQMNAQITERHSHRHLPAYLSPGLDAFVQLSQEKNLRFINTLEQPVQMKVVREGLYLKVEFYAAKPDETATIRVKFIDNMKERTIIRYSHDLPVDKSMLLQVGQPGQRVTVYRTNNSTGKEQVISRDYYAPINKIILTSSRQPIPTVGEEGSGDGSTNNENLNGEDLNGVDQNDGNVNEGETSNSEVSGDNNSLQYDKGGNLIQVGEGK